jgi:manganese oxidase
MIRILAKALAGLAVVLTLQAILFVAICSAQSPEAATPKVHTYYIATDEVEWNYAPSGIDKMMGMKFEGYETVFTERGPHRIGTTYRKALYREYTDATFSKLKPRAPEWEHLGILGPLLRAEVGDTISVVFKNNGTHPYSIPMACSTTKTSRAPHTTTAAQPSSTKVASSPRARHTPTRGKFQSAPGPVQVIPVPLCGFITRTLTSRRM